MADLGTGYAIGDALLLSAQTKDTSGTPTDADSLPTYQVYEQGGSTAIASGTFAKRDDANTVGYYEAEITLSTGAGFERGKQYRVRKLATVDGSDGIAIDTFAIGHGQTSFSALAGWPTLEDVQARYDDLRLTAPADDTITAALNACVSAWEQKTDYHPFLADADDTTWLFQPDDLCLLDFGVDGGPGGFISITSVTVGVTYANPTGIELVAGRDYLLKPANAANRSRPYTYLTGKRVEYDAGEASIEVIGRAGFAETVPADVWEAVLRCVMAMLLPSQGIAISGGYERITELDTTVQYGAQGPVYTAITYFEKYEQSVLNTYRRLRVV